MTSSLARGEERDIVAGIKLVNVRNTGVAFGQLQNAGTIVAVVIAVAIVALLVYFARNLSRPWIWLPTGMLLGGALGNVIDRVTEGAVIDFLKLPHWPAFNVADSAITIGVVVLVLRHGARRCSSTSRLRPPGERLDAFLAQPLGSRSRAVRLIEAGACSSTGRRRARASACAAASGSSCDDALSATPRRRSGCARRAVRDRLRGRAPHRRRQACGRRRASGPRPPAGHARAGARGPRRGRRGGLRGRGSCIASTARRPGLLVVAKSDEVHRALKASLAARTMRREYLALVEGRPPALTGTIEAPIGRDRRVRTRMSTDTRRPQARDHALRARARAAAGDAAARATADGPHAPDPRPPAGDRPSRLRRSGVRHRGPVRPASAVPARGAARVPASRGRRAGRRELAAAGRPRSGAAQPAAGPERCGGAARPKAAPPPHDADRAHRR